MSSWVFPAASAAISAVFATLVLMRYTRSHKRHLLLWTLGLFGFAAAAAAQVIANTSGSWPEGVYRVYYFLIGSLVATMGAGTMYLMNRRKLADIFLYAVIALVAVQGVVCAVTPVDAALLASSGGETGVRAASLPMRILTAVLSIAGALALGVGAAISWWGTKRPHNLAIAAGAVLLSVGGGTAGVASTEGFAAYALYLGNLAGIALLFAGFLLSRPVGEPAPKAAPAPVSAPPT